MASRTTAPPQAPTRGTETPERGCVAPGPPIPSRWTLVRLFPGYLLYTLFQVLFAPILAFRAVRKGRRRRYHGVGWLRMTGGLRPPRRADWVLVVASGAGERRTALQTAEEIVATRTRDVAVLLQETPDRDDHDFPVGPAPFNSPLSAIAALLLWRPRAILFVEFANNYHLVWWARLFGVRTGLFNVNLSEGRTRRLRRKPLGRWQFGLVPRYAAQAKVHARRLAALGVPSGAICVTGVGMGRFRGDADDADAVRSTWQTALGFEPSTPVIVAGSTYPAEEEIVVRAFRALRQRYPDARLVLAPRHLDRREPLEGALADEVWRRRSEGSPEVGGTPDVWLLDTRGELRDVYAAATAAFVGGSLVPGVGGHSPIEPLAWGVPTTVGPHTTQQEAVVELGKEAGAVTVVRREEDLVAAWMRAVGDVEFRLDAALRARGLLQGAEGAYTRAFDAVVGR